MVGNGLWNLKRSTWLLVAPLSFLRNTQNLICSARFSILALVSLRLPSASASRMTEQFAFGKCNLQFNTPGVALDLCWGGHRMSCCLVEWGCSLWRSRGRCPVLYLRDAFGGASDRGVCQLASVKSPFLPFLKILFIHYWIRLLMSC